MPRTVVVPAALLVSLLFVLASAPAMVVVPVAALVSFAFVAASDPLTPVPGHQALTGMSCWRGSNSCQGLAVSSAISVALSARL